MKHLKIFYFIILISLISCSTEKVDLKTERALSSIQENLPNGPVQDNEWVEIARLPVDREGMLTCSYTELLKDRFSDDQIDLMKSELKAELEEFEETLKDQKTKPNKIQKIWLNEVNQLIQSNSLHQDLIDSLDTICKTSIAVGEKSVRTTAIAASSLTTLAYFPFRFVYQFGRGAFGANLSKNQTTYTQRFGKNIGGSLALIPVLTYAKSILASSNPELLAVTILPYIDFQSALACENPNAKNLKLIKFCQNYQGIKNISIRGLSAGEKIGSKLHKFLDKSIVFRSQTEISQKICAKDPQNQMKIAERVIERHLSDLKSRFKNLESLKIVPPTIKSCVKIQVISKNNEDTDFPKGVLDGLELTREVLPIISDQELQNEKPLDVCLEIFNSKVSTDSSDSNIWQALNVQINPDRYSKPIETQIPISQDHLVKMPIEKIGKLRNIIFAVAPLSGDIEKFKILKPEFEKLQKELKTESKKIQALFKEKTYRACQNKVQESRFDYENFKKLNASLLQFQMAKRIEEFRVFKNSFKKNERKTFGLFKNLKLDWEIIESNDIQSVIDLAHSTDVANIVILTHGRSNGKLVDQAMDEMPTTSFNWISPSLASLNFYSCFSDKINELYSLTSKLGNAKSYHQIRYIHHVAPNLLFNETELAPLQAFGNYLKKIDEKLYLATIGNQEVQTLNQSNLPSFNPEQVCHITLQNFKIKGGSMGFVMNRKFIGLSSIYKPINEFDFPCSWLSNESKNTLIIQNQSLSTESTIESYPFGISLINSKGSQVEPSQIKHLTRADGSYKGSNISW